MKLEELILKYINQYVEIAGSADAQFQCVDWANLYIRDVLKLPIIEWTNAIDYPSKAGNKYEWIINTPEGIPQKGDLIIFNNNPYGHISVCLMADLNNIISSDQNFPTGSKVALRVHNYNQVVGWLHPKSATITPTSVQITDQTKIPQIDNMEVQALKGKLEDLRICEIQRTEKDQAIKNRDQTIKDLMEKLENPSTITVTVPPTSLSNPPETVLTPPTQPSLLRRILNCLKELWNYR